MGATQQEQQGQPVRVVLEGVGWRVGPHNTLLAGSVRVATKNGCMLLLDPSQEGVGVEWLTPVRVWSAGDVVAGSAHVWVRDDQGDWRTTGHTATLTDASMDRLVDLRGATILRQQVTA